jgi:hypothetical protein
MAKLVAPVTATVPTSAVAVMVVAPTASLVAAVSATVAMPEASVKAVAAGVIDASVASVLKVTTAFGTTAPAASFRVAFSVAGASLEMEVTVAPAALVSVNVKLGAAVPVTPVVVPLVVPLERPDPLPQPARTAKVAAKKSAAESLEISWFRKFRTKKKKFCTEASPLCNPHR